MKFTRIYARMITKTFLWKSWITGYDITLELDGNYWFRLQQRQTGLTPRGNPRAWRVGSSWVHDFVFQTFTKKCKQYARGEFDYRAALHGKYDFRGQAWFKVKKKKYFYSDIITLDFGRK